MINYLRISITDRCNFRCFYCKPSENFTYVPHKEILRYEQILKVARIFAEFGIDRIRLTGGEPLIRRDVEFLIEKLKKDVGIKKIYITTNGFFLSQKAQSLFNAGCDGVNISLDTLNPKKFARITRNREPDGLKHVLKGIETAVNIGFEQVKINTVALKGINSDEFQDIIKYSNNIGAIPRIIQLMPSYVAGEDDVMSLKQIISAVSGFTTGLPASDYERVPEFVHFLSSSAHHCNNTKLGSYPKVEPVDIKIGNGPASYYSLKYDSQNKYIFGIIESMSEHICSNCNRVRLTADGHLMECLFENEPVSIKSVLDVGADEKQIRIFVQKFLKSKQAHNKVSLFYGMNSIGG